MTNRPDTSELERRVEFEQVGVKDENDSFVLELSYRETKGYSLAKKVDVVGEEALVHLVRNYISPPQKLLSGRVNMSGALPPKGWQPNLRTETFQIPKNITSLGVGQDYWSLSGVLKEQDGKVFLDINGETLIKLETTQGKGRVVLEHLVGGVGKHPYNRVSVVSVERPSWPADKLVVNEINYRRNGSLEIYTAFL